MKVYIQMPLWHDASNDHQPLKKSHVIAAQLQLYMRISVVGSHAISIFSPSSPSFQQETLSGFIQV